MSIDGDAALSVEAAIGGSAMFDVSAVFNAWEDCPLEGGFEIGAELQASAHSGASVSGSYNLSCIDANGEDNNVFQGGMISYSGVAFEVTGSTEIHTAVTGDIQGQFVIPFVSPEKHWTLPAEQ